MSSWWCPCAARPRGPVLVGAVFLSLLHVADVGAAVAAVGACLVLTASFCGKEASAGRIDALPTNRKEILPVCKQILAVCKEILAIVKKYSQLSDATLQIILPTVRTGCPARKN